MTKTPAPATQGPATQGAAPVSPAPGSPAARSAQAEDWNLELVHGCLDERVRDVSLRVTRGQCVVIVGPNGAGKSSLLRLLAGLEALQSGQLHVGGRQHLQRDEWARLVGWLPQRPRLPEGLTCEELVATARYRFGEHPSESRRLARQVMSETGSGDLIGRDIDRISGGELQRVLISTLVAQETPILLIDEPANHLDPRHQVETYQRFGALRARTEKTIVLVTHDIRLARLLGPDVRVLGMEQGALAFDEGLESTELAAHLSKLYRIPFFSTDSGASLAVDLDAHLREGS